MPSALYYSWFYHLKPVYHRKKLSKLTIYREVFFTFASKLCVISTIRIEDLNSVIFTVRNENHAIWLVNCDSFGTHKLALFRSFAAELWQKVSKLIKHLYAVVGFVGHVDLSLVVCSDSRGSFEFSVLDTSRSKTEKVTFDLFDRRYKRYGWLGYFTGLNGMIF